LKEKPLTVFAARTAHNNNKAISGLMFDLWVAKYNYSLPCLLVVQEFKNDAASSQHDE